MDWKGIMMAKNAAFIKEVAIFENSRYPERISLINEFVFWWRSGNLFGRQFSPTR